MSGRTALKFSSSAVLVAVLGGISLAQFDPSSKETAPLPREKTSAVSPAAATAVPAPVVPPSCAFDSQWSAPTLVVQESADFFGPHWLQGECVPADGSSGNRYGHPLVGFTTLRWDEAGNGWWVETVRMPLPRNGQTAQCPRGECVTNGDMLVRVKENQTGTFMFSGAVTSDAGLMGQCVLCPTAGSAPIAAVPPPPSCTHCSKGNPLQGTWVRELPGFVIAATFTPEEMRLQVLQAGIATVKMTLFADYSVTKDGIVHGVITAVDVNTKELEGVQPGVMNELAIHMGVALQFLMDSPFSFRTRQTSAGLMVSNVKAACAGDMDLKEPLALLGGMYKLSKDGSIPEPKLTATNELPYSAGVCQTPPGVSMIGQPMPTPLPVAPACGVPACPVQALPPGPPVQLGYPAGATFGSPLVGMPAGVTLGCPPVGMPAGVPLGCPPVAACVPTYVPFGSPPVAVGVPAGMLPAPSPSAGELLGASATVPVLSSLMGQSPVVGGVSSSATSTFTPLPSPAPQQCTAGMTLPSPRYVQHYPQYYAPDPTFPLPRELASQEDPEGAARRAGASAPYVIESPDVLSIVVVQRKNDGTLELVNTGSGKFLVRPDGTVGLGKWGSVTVAEATCEHAADAIHQLLLKTKDFRHLTETPERLRVKVEVAAANSKRYFVILQSGVVGEQVYVFPATGTDTVLDAVCNVRGPADVAAEVDLCVIRRCPGPDVMWQKLPVDWTAIQRGDSTTNYQILPGDRVYVKSKVKSQTMSLPPVVGGMVPAGTAPPKSGELLTSVEVFGEVAPAVRGVLNGLSEMRAADKSDPPPMIPPAAEPEPMEKQSEPNPSAVPPMVPPTPPGNVSYQNFLDLYYQEVWDLGGSSQEKMLKPANYPQTTCPARFVQKGPDGGIVAIPENTDDQPTYYRTAALALIETHLGKDFVLLEERAVVLHGTVASNLSGPTSDPCEYRLTYSKRAPVAAVLANEKANSTLQPTGEPSARTPRNITLAECIQIALKETTIHTTPPMTMCSKPDRVESLELPDNAPGGLLHHRRLLDAKINCLLANLAVAYWELYAAYHNLRAYEEGLREAYLAYRNTDPQVQAGSNSSQNQDQARAQFERLRRQVIDARRTLQESERALRGLMGLLLHDGTCLVPTGKPNPELPNKDFQKAAQAARACRPEVQICRDDLRECQGKLALSRNGLRPDVRVIVECKPVPENALTGQAEPQCHDWVLDGLRLTMPQGFRDANGAVREAQLKLARSNYQLRDTELKVMEYLVKQYRAVIQTQADLEPARAEREALEKWIAEREAKCAKGRLSEKENLDCITAKIQLASSIAAEQQAIANCMIALARFEFAKGTIQQYHHIGTDVPAEPAVVAPMPREGCSFETPCLTGPLPMLPPPVIPQPMPGPPVAVLGPSVTFAPPLPAGIAAPGFDQLADAFGQMLAAQETPTPTPMARPFSPPAAVAPRYTVYPAPPAPQVPQNAVLPPLPQSAASPMPPCPMVPQYWNAPPQCPTPCVTPPVCPVQLSAAREVQVLVPAPRVPSPPARTEPFGTWVREVGPMAYILKVEPEVVTMTAFITREMATGGTVTDEFILTGEYRLLKDGKTLVGVITSVDRKLDGDAAGDIEFGALAKELSYLQRALAEQPFALNYRIAGDALLVGSVWLPELGDFDSELWRRMSAFGGRFWNPGDKKLTKPKAVKASPPKPAAIPAGYVVPGTVSPMPMPGTAYRPMDLPMPAGYMAPGAVLSMPGTGYPVVTPSLPGTGYSPAIPGGWMPGGVGPR